MPRRRESKMRVLMIALLIAMMPVVVCLAQEKDPLDDWYGMLEVQAGTTYEFENKTARPYVAGKVLGWKELTGVIGTEFDFDEETEEKGPVAALAGATYSLGSLTDHGVEVSWAKYFAFNVGACVTYQWQEEEWGWRAMLSIVDLSFSDGNAKRQRER